MKKKSLFLLLVISILCVVFCGCADEKNKFRISNANSRDGEFLYFSTPYKYTTYSFMLNYVYTGDDASRSYGFVVKNKEDERIDELDVLINGVAVSYSSLPYLIKGNTISATVGITSSALPMINTADSYDEFTVELYVYLDDTYTILASQEFTFDQVKKMCSS